MHENRETSSVSARAGRSRKANNRTLDMHAGEESDCAVVPMKLVNKEVQASAEPVEGRARTKENAGQPITSPPQSGERVSRGLIGVREAARATQMCASTPLIQGKSRMR